MFKYVINVQIWNPVYTQMNGNWVTKQSHLAGHDFNNPAWVISNKSKLTIANLKQLSIPAHYICP